MYVQTKFTYLWPVMKKTESKYCSCLYYSSNALARIMSKMSDEEFAHIGLSSSYAFLLMTVNEKQGIQPKEISEQMQLTASTVTRLIEKMEYRGFLKRCSVGWSTEVYSTEAGLEMQHKIKEVWRNLNKRYTDVLGKEASNKLTADIYAAVRKFE